MKKKIDTDKLKRFALYFLAGAGILTLVFVGTLDKNNSSTTISLSAFSDSGFGISSDQVSEAYLVADLSSALNLPSAEDAAYHYAATSSLYSIGQTSEGKIEKGYTIDTSKFSRGVTTYVVNPGESMEWIATKFGLTTDQIRWSNGLKNTNLSAGATLYLTKNVSGIVYTVKSGDTLEGIASKYGSTVENIRHLNDIEVTGISEGMKIAIEGGSLPETERPEYVPPRPVYTYSTYGNTGTRVNISVVIPNGFGSYGGYGWGQCTSWAWYNRQDLPGNLGNASSWAYNAAAAGFPVDHNPQAGDIFQHGGGWYGHVGYVESVNGDGSITITEANYNYYAGRVTRATIPANVVPSLNYIHRR